MDYLLLVTKQLQLLRHLLDICSAGLRLLGSDALKSFNEPGSHLTTSTDNSLLPLFEIILTTATDRFIRLNGDIDSLVEMAGLRLTNGASEACVKSKSDQEVTFNGLLRDKQESDVLAQVQY
ncbi:unnamed protein product [Protopolystoma xenopodis]|uniref:Uncharacterized protein n=1 Tax=Protopolystoma xenopodis TaxID=117903 RepID=A0A3S5ATC2_9PLAT|nr:unnamed protein product [Protopolystoma xenopodis]